MGANFAKEEPEAFEEENRLFETMIKERQLKPVVQAAMPMAQAAEALEVIRQRKAMGKLLLTTPRYEAEYGGGGGSRPRL